MNLKYLLKDKLIEKGLNSELAGDIVASLKNAVNLNLPYAGTATNDRAMNVAKHLVSVQKINIVHYGFLQSEYTERYLEDMFIHPKCHSIIIYLINEIPLNESEIKKLLSKKYYPIKDVKKLNLLKLKYL